MKQVSLETKSFKKMLEKVSHYIFEIRLMTLYTSHSENRWRVLQHKYKKYTEAEVQNNLNFPMKYSREKGVIQTFYQLKINKHETKGTVTVEEKNVKEPEISSKKLKFEQK